MKQVHTVRVTVLRCVARPIHGLYPHAAYRPNMDVMITLSMLRYIQSFNVSTGSSALRVLQCMYVCHWI